MELPGAHYPPSDGSWCPQDMRSGADDPLDRAHDIVRRSRAGMFKREIAVFASDVSSAQGVRDSEILAQLMPGFWQTQAALAWAYVRLGAYEAGLEAVARATELAPRTARVDL